MKFFSELVNDGPEKSCLLSIDGMNILINCGLTVKPQDIVNNDEPYWCSALKAIEKFNNCIHVILISSPTKLTAIRHVIAKLTTVPHVIMTSMCLESGISSMEWFFTDALDAHYNCFVNSSAILGPWASDLTTPTQDCPYKSMWTRSRETIRYSGIRDSITSYFNMQNFKCPPTAKDDYPRIHIVAFYQRFTQNSVSSIIPSFQEVPLGRSFTFMAIPSGSHLGAAHWKISDLPDFDCAFLQLKNAPQIPQPVAGHALASNFPIRNRGIVVCEGILRTIGDKKTPGGISAAVMPMRKEDCVLLSADTVIIMESRPEINYAAAELDDQSQPDNSISSLFNISQYTEKETCIDVVDSQQTSDTNSQPLTAVVKATVHMLSNRSIARSLNGSLTEGDLLSVVFAEAVRDERQIVLMEEGWGGRGLLALIPSILHAMRSCKLHAPLFIIGAGAAQFRHLGEVCLDWLHENLASQATQTHNKTSPFWWEVLEMANRLFVATGPENLPKMSRKFWSSGIWMFAGGGFAGGGLSSILNSIWKDDGCKRAFVLLDGTTTHSGAWPTKSILKETGIISRQEHSVVFDLRGASVSQLSTSTEATAKIYDSGARWGAILFEDHLPINLEVQPNGPVKLDQPSLKECLTTAERSPLIPIHLPSDIKRNTCELKEILQDNSLANQGHDIPLPSPLTSTVKCVSKASLVNATTIFDHLGQMKVILQGGFAPGPPQLPEYFAKPNHISKEMKSSHKDKSHKKLTFHSAPSSLMDGFSTFDPDMLI